MGVKAPAITASPLETIARTSSGSQMGLTRKQAPAARAVFTWAGSVGGPAYVKALKGPFPYIPMMPTGGVSAANAADWFAAGVVAVGAGSELCPPQLAKDGKFDEIARRAAEFNQAVQAARAAQKS